MAALRSIFSSELFSFNFCSELEILPELTVWCLQSHQRRREGRAWDEQPRLAVDQLCSGRWRGGGRSATNHPGGHGGARCCRSARGQHGREPWLGGPRDQLRRGSGETITVIILLSLISGYIRPATPDSSTHWKRSITFHLCFPPADSTTRQLVMKSPHT